MKTRAFLSIVALALIATGCSEVGGLVDELTNPATASVAVQSASFNPSSVSVRVGGTVTWTNAGPVAHTITPNNAGQAGAWPSKTMAAQQGVTFSHTFTTAGTFNYFCTIHPGMTGTVHVE
jgi:plastocyanin